jgi:hypothetical protein
MYGIVPCHITPQDQAQKDQNYLAENKFGEPFFQVKAKTLALVPPLISFKE